MIFKHILEDAINDLDKNNDGSKEMKELQDVVSDNNDINRQEIDDAQEAEFGPDEHVDDIMDEGVGSVIAASAAAALLLFGPMFIGKKIAEYRMKKELAASRQAIYNNMDVIKQALTAAEKDPEVAKYKHCKVNKMSFDQFNAKYPSDESKINPKSVKQLAKYEFYVIDINNTWFITTIVDRKSGYATSYVNTKFKNPEDLPSHYIFSKISIASGVWLNGLTNLLTWYDEQNAVDAGDAAAKAREEAIKTGREFA